MKNYLLLIMLFAFLCLSATTITNVITSKPALPVVVRHRTFFYDDWDQVDAYISNCVKDGYIIKTVTGAGTDHYTYWIVVAEKY